MDHRHPSQHRLKRNALRAALWLAQLIRYMPDVLRLPPRVLAYVERRLDLLAGFVVHLVVMRAHHCRPGQRQRNGFAATRAAARHDVRAHVTHSLRAVIGAQLRRDLKAQRRGPKNLKARADAILYALQNLDRLAARFIRRMRKGLSRRLSAHSRVKTLSLHPAALKFRCGGSLLQISFGEELRAAFDAAAPP